ncbi:alcohol dehydrogenase catalytic domain-containing protein [Streptomyces sp. NPDC005962]|uniref:alcohol dehydrogenase catalytic domain-containing protein n=1 Tax=Streptomyces sp. NPDC005962 TaxID=3154466 RepID=UPI0033C9CD0C
MQAIGVHDFGGPEALRVLDLPEPQAGPGEVRIRVHAAAVSPTDVMLRTGSHAVRMPDHWPPFVPGTDAAGVIEQLGPGTDGRFAVGRRVVAMVLFISSHGGAYAEQVVVPAASVVPAPEGADFPAAAPLAFARWPPMVFPASWTARCRPPGQCPPSPMAGPWPSCEAGPARTSVASGCAR